jgi:hypothetical protein
VIHFPRSEGVNCGVRGAMIFATMVRNWSVGLTTAMALACLSFFGCTSESPRHSSGGEGGDSPALPAGVTRSECTTPDGCAGVIECFEWQCSDCVCERFAEAERLELTLNSALVGAVTLSNDDLVALLGDADLGSPLVVFDGSSLKKRPKPIRVETEIIDPLALYLGPKGESLIVVTARSLISLTPDGTVNWTYESSGVIGDSDSYDNGDVGVLVSRDEAGGRELVRIAAESGDATTVRTWLEGDEIPWQFIIDGDTLVVALTSASPHSPYLVLYGASDVKVESDLNIGDYLIQVDDLARADSGGGYLMSYQVDYYGEYYPTGGLQLFSEEKAVLSETWRLPVEGSNGFPPANRVLPFSGGFAFERGGYLRLMSSTGVLFDNQVGCYGSVRLSSTRVLCGAAGGFFIYDLTLPQIPLLPLLSACTTATECFDEYCCGDPESGQGYCTNLPCRVGVRCEDDASCDSAHCVGGLCVAACGVPECASGRCIADVFQEPVCLPDCLKESACDSYSGLSCTETVDTKGNTVFACLP